METDAPLGGGSAAPDPAPAPAGGGFPSAGFPEPGDFPGQPRFPDQPGMFGQPGFPGQPGMFGQPGSAGQPRFPGRPGFGGLGPRSSRPSRAPVTGPGLVVAAIGAIIALIIFGVIASHMSSGSPFGQDPAGSCLGGPAPG